MRRVYLWAKAIVAHPLRASQALFWLVLGKKRRAHNRFVVLIEDDRYRYEKWLRKNGELKAAERARIQSDVAGMEIQPRILLTCPVPKGCDEARLRDTVASLGNQLYANWTLALVPEEPEFSFENNDERIRVVSSDGRKLVASHDYIGWLQPGDRLAEHALYEFAKSVAEAAPGKPALLYSDEDQINRRGVRRHSHFKPRWNFELQVACDYIGGLCLIRRDLVPKTVPVLLPPQARYEQILSLGQTLSPADVHHVPKILYHRFVPRFLAANMVKPAASGINHEKALTYVFKDSAGIVVRDKFGQVRLAPALPAERPMVSLIIPTRDLRKLTSNCVNSILTKTDYDNFEILIVNNDSQKPKTHQFFAEISQKPKVRVLDYPGEFNYSAINNFAVSKAKGSYIGLINNDTEVITPGWLGELMAQAIRPEVGAVGAKLLYKDGRIQHAGVFTGMGGLAGHGHRNLKANKPGYFYRAHLSQYVSAVTAACLIVEKAKFEAVGGLDEEAFKVAFNDVDFCLKIQAAGYHNVYHPHAVLYHYESKSRGKDLKGEKRNRYLREAAELQARWGTDREVDRYFNQNLALHREDFVL